MFSTMLKNCINNFTLKPKIPKRSYAQIKRKKPLNPEYIKEIPVNQYALAPHERNRIYVWGNLQTGALGIPQPKEKDSHPIQHFKCPKRMHFAEKTSILHVATGFGFTLFATEDTVYGSGLNTESQIGYHEMRSENPLEILFATQPIHLAEKPENAKILKIGAGRAHSAVLTNYGLYLFGSNAYGQCGRKIVENEEYKGSRMFKYIEKIDEKSIKDVQCGQDHTMVILEDGSVYSCGWGADGQTGLGHYNSSAEFTKVNGDISGENITELACRSDFVLAINANNQVFGWGNTEYSQMVLADGSQQVATPTHLNFFEKIGKVTSVATGGSACLALAENNVYVWGFGLLGLGPLVQETKIPTAIPQNLFGYNAFNDDVRVVSVHAGLSHMAAVTNKGDLFTWGRNRSCCLGLGFDDDQYFPLKVAVGGSVNHVSCAVDHTVAVCSSYLSE